MKFLLSAVVALLFAIVFGEVTHASSPVDWGGERFTLWSKSAATDTRE